MGTLNLANPDKSNEAKKQDDANDSRGFLTMKDAFEEAKEKHEKTGQHPDKPSSGRSFWRSPMMWGPVVVATGGYIAWKYYSKGKSRLKGKGRDGVQSKADGKAESFDIKNEDAKAFRAKGAGKSLGSTTGDETDYGAESHRKTANQR